MLAKTATILAILATLVGFGTWLVRYYHKQKQIALFEKLSEGYQQQDQFDKAAEAIKQAQELDHDNREIKIRLVEIQTFGIATQYDQIKRIHEPKTIENLKDNCRQLKTEVPNEARITALCGIVAELDDYPSQAIKEYESAARLNPHYANVYNYLGYTKFKWNRGNPHWADDALNNFQNAIAIDKGYGTPYMNSAVVYLEIGDLDKARKSLEDGAVYIQDNPRAQLLWGHYYFEQSQQFSRKGLPESRRSLQAAEAHYEEAKRLSEGKTADIRLYLGRAYEEDDRHDDAIAEYTMAAQLDPWNLDACLNHAKVLYLSGVRNEATVELARCQNLHADIIADFTKRMRTTTDTWAREWLLAQIDSYSDSKNPTTFVFSKKPASKAAGKNQSKK